MQILSMILENHQTEVKVFCLLHYNILPNIFLRGGGTTSLLVVVVVVIGVVTAVDG